MRPHLIEKILPAGTVHLLGGPSGAGKTRLLFQWLASLVKGESILGLAISHSLTIGYVCMDRSKISIEETMESLGLDHLQIPNLTIISCNTKAMTLAQIPTLFDKLPDLLIIDGLPTLLPTGNSNNYHEVANFLRLCQKICDQYGTTILGILHAAKTKENERYENPRQRISGSVAWAAYSETVFILEPIKPENPNDKRRTLFVLPRNSAEFTKDYTFDSTGRLIELEIAEEQDKYSILLSQIPTDSTLSRNEILDLAAALGIGRAKCDAWLAQCVDNSQIIKPAYGQYQRRPVN